MLTLLFATMLKDYYGIGNTDLVAYVLDPNQQVPEDSNVRLLLQKLVLLQSSRH
jgi:hypothetical protein